MKPPKRPSGDGTIVWTNDDSHTGNGERIVFEDARDDANRNIITIHEGANLSPGTDGASLPAAVAAALAVLVRGNEAAARAKLTALANAYPDDLEAMAALATAAAACGDDETFGAKRKRFRGEWAAGRRPPGAVSLLVRILGANNASGAHAAAALAVDAGDVVAPALLGIVERETGIAAAAAARALATLNIQRARPRLANIGGDESAWARFDALEALARLGDPRGIAELVDHMSARDAHVREKAACCLGGAGDLKAGDSLLGLTIDPDEAVRRAAATALGELGERQFVFPLRRLLSDTSESVRVFAAGALASFDDTDGVPTLLGAMRNLNDSHVRLAANFFLTAHRHQARIAEIVSSQRPSTDFAGTDAVKRLDADFVLSRLRWRRWFQRGSP